MPKQTICLQNPAKVSIKHSALCIEQNCQSKSVPLEDIWVVILETHQVLISTAALSAIVDAGIGVMLCGRNHMPNGLLLPLGAHSRHAAIVDDQLAIPKPLRKRLWQRIVVQKITNQARVLDLISLEGDCVRKFSSKVLSGDTTNMESAAASVYFRKYTKEGTRREGPSCAPLDYGYAVLRAGIARTAVSGGWLVSRGLHHDSSLNAFNLVDDLIEPFRPIVDLMVRQFELEGELDSAKKAKLASLFAVRVSVGNNITTVQNAIELELESLRRAVLSTNSAELQLPKIIPLSYVEME